MLQVAKEPIATDQQQQQAEIAAVDHLSEQVDHSQGPQPELSWQFLEQVSSLDRKLRSQVDNGDLQLSNGLLSSDCNLMSHSQLAEEAAAAGAKTAATVSANQANNIDGQLSDAYVSAISRNGFALTGQLNVEILSQQIATTTTTTTTTEGVAEQEPQFQFTTPTSTFRRKKQQQEQQQQLKEQQQSIEKSPTTATSSATPSRRAAARNNATLQQQQQHQPQQRRATMLAGPESGNFGATVRTLPAISRQQREREREKERERERERDIQPSQASHKMGLMTASNNNGSGGNEAVASSTNAERRSGGRGGAHAHPSSSAMPSSGIGIGGTVGGFVDGIETYLGLIGWRKKCLYTLLLLLMLLIITNLVLTLWILKVMEFSTDGMGQLKIVPGGIQLSGQAIIMDMLRASTIRSRHGQPIAIESSRNFSINTRDPNGMLENHLFLGHDKLECLSAGFRINDTNGRNLFSVNRNEVTIGAHALRIDGEGGAIFRESIQTPHVRAEPGRELRLESPTRQLELTAAKDITLQSRAGGIELLALEDVRLRALDGSLRLESSKILMPNLRTAQPPILGSAQSRDHLHRVFQLCACSNGKLFLAAPHSICAGDDSTVCR